LDTPGDLRAAREALSAEYADAFSRLAQILFEEDPMGLNFEDNTDEYDAEAGTILPRLRHCTTVADIQALLYAEFLRWFGAETVAPPERYRRAAERVAEEMAHWRIP
jgi:hypothetical protein